jgi:hypothetical protein
MKTIHRFLLLLVGLALVVLPLSAVHASTSPVSGSAGRGIIISPMTVDVRDWTFRLGGKRYGFVQWEPALTELFYGHESVQVPVPVRTVAAPLVIVPLLLGLAGAVRLRRTWLTGA